MLHSDEQDGPFRQFFYSQEKIEEKKEKITLKIKKVKNIFCVSLKLINKSRRFS